MHRYAKTSLFGLFAILAIITICCVMGGRLSTFLEPTVKMVLKSGDGTETKFSIPKTYISRHFQSVDISEENFIPLVVLKDDFGPLNYNSDSTLRNSKNFNQKTVRITVKSSVPAGFSRGSQLIKDSYSYHLRNEGPYAVYGTLPAKKLKEKKGYDELYIPEGGLFEKPSYVECSTSPINNPLKKQTACWVTQRYSDHIYVVYQFSADQIINAPTIEKKVNNLIWELMDDRHK